MSWLLAYTAHKPLGLGFTASGGAPLNQQGHSHLPPSYQGCLSSKAGVPTCVCKNNAHELRNGLAARGFNVGEGGAVASMLEGLGLRSGRNGS